VIEKNQESEKIQPEVPQPWKIVLRNTVYILLALLIFLFTLDLMIASLQHLGKDAAEVIILATSNPFTGLFIGLLVTALIQSSSATTSMVVALVASGSITLEGAIPILMGANVGTTITSTIVSLGFITKKKEFRRAVTIGTYHDFFNILTVLILFPLEYYFGFLSGLAQYIATSFFNEPIGMAQKQFNLLGDRFGFIINMIVTSINNGFVLAIMSIGLLFGSILFFRKVLSNTLGFGSQERFQQFFFKSPLKSFAWGLLTTAAIRSSTVTTSLVVPLVAKKVVRIKSAFPFVLGANMGTTITAFIAALFNSNAAISIAIAHFLFNLIGVLLFFPIPYLNQLPIKLADGLGRLTLKYRLVGFLYVLLTFFFIPFSLIYLNKDAVSVQELTYQHENSLTGDKQSFTIINKTYLNQPITNWIQYEPTQDRGSDPLNIRTVYRRKNLLLLNNELYELNKPGFCRDGEDENGKFKTCIREILPVLSLNASLSLDSVYVFERSWYQPDKVDSATMVIYISASQNLLAKKELVGPHGTVTWKEELLRIKEK
jgi:solute carrier family 34 (sodium-dependent phosphate cotransporter)